MKEMDEKHNKATTDAMKLSVSSSASSSEDSKDNTQTVPSPLQEAVDSLKMSYEPEEKPVPVIEKKKSSKKLIFILILMVGTVVIAVSFSKHIEKTAHGIGNWLISLDFDPEDTQKIEQLNEQKIAFERSQIELQEVIDELKQELKESADLLNQRKKERELFLAVIEQFRVHRPFVLEFNEYCWGQFHENTDFYQAVIKKHHDFVEFKNYWVRLVKKENETIVILYPPKELVLENIMNKELTFTYASDLPTREVAALTKLQEMFNISPPYSLH